MGEVVPLKARRGSAREQLLAMIQHQAQVQGKSLTQFLQELQSEVVRAHEPRPQSRPDPVSPVRSTFISPVMRWTCSLSRSATCATGPSLG